MSPAAASLFLGATQQFSAAVTGSLNMAVNWTVNNIPGGNATVGTISAAGLYTAPANLPAAMISVQAASNADPAKSATASVTVQSDVAVSVSPAAASVELGAQQQFTAAVSGSGNPNATVTWTVNGVAGGNAMLGTVDASGLYLAPSILPMPAAVNVTATSVADSAKSSAASATITSNLSVSVSGPANVDNGAVAQFTATVLPAPMSNPSLGVTWSVNAITGGDATFGTIDAAGLYTAPLHSAPPTVTITAASFADPAKSDSLVVAINPVISISISPSPTVNVPLEGMQAFTATVTGTTNQNVIWDVNGVVGGDQNTIGAIDNSGIYFAPMNMPAPGATITVRAASQADPTKSASASVTLISNILVGASTLSGANASVRAVGRRETICAVLSGTTNPSPVLGWRVNGILDGDAVVGQIVSSPVMPLMCPQPGIAGAFLFTMDYVAPVAVPATYPVKVRISSAADPAKSAEVQIMIVSAVTVTVAPASVTVAPGASEQFSATVVGSPDTTTNWSVAGTGCGGMACGTVSMSGLYTAMPMATAMASDTVTATSQDGGASDSATVTIAGPAPVISGLAPGSANAGAASQFLLRVLGVNFASGAELVINGASRSTSCLSATECTTTIQPADVAAAGSISIQIRNGVAPAEHSNAVAFEVVAPVTTEEVILLDAAAPQATGKDIAVVDFVPAPGAENNVTLLGLFVNNNCNASGGPVTIQRPPSAATNFTLCLGGADATQTFTLSGPSLPDITISNVRPLLLGFVQVQLTLNVPHSAQPGLRTLFVRDSNGNTTAVAGGIAVK
ncbi:MAG: hypothetical protein ACRD5G_00255 [Candidatus Acidiferrales bacterium]